MAWYDVPPKLAGGRPAPIYWDEELQDWVAPHGRKGVPGQILYGPDGQPITVVEHKLAVRAAEAETAISALAAALKGANDKTLSDIATTLSSQSTAEKQDALAALVGAIDAAAVSDPAASGAVIALLKGVLSRLQAVEGKIDGITTEDGNVKSQLTGSLVEVGDKTYSVSGGDTLRGKAADKPDAAAAHAVIPYCYYFSIDTGVVEATDGNKWVVM